MSDISMIGCALFVALLITKKNAPFNLAKWVRLNGLTVVNCPLCCFGWTVIGLYLLSITPISVYLAQVVHIGALVGYGWLGLALIGVATWDN